MKSLILILMFPVIAFSAPPAQWVTWPHGGKVYLNILECPGQCYSINRGEELIDVEIATIKNGKLVEDKALKDARDAKKISDDLDKESKRQNKDQKKQFLKALKSKDLSNQELKDAIKALIEVMED
jgi:hypothetical protein